MIVYTTMCCCGPTKPHWTLWYSTFSNRAEYALHAVIRPRTPTFAPSSPHSRGPPRVGEGPYNSNRASDNRTREKMQSNQDSRVCRETIRTHAGQEHDAALEQLIIHSEQLRYQRFGPQTIPQGLQIPPHLDIHSICFDGKLPCSNPFNHISDSEPLIGLDFLGPSSSVSPPPETASSTLLYIEPLQIHSRPPEAVANQNAHISQGSFPTNASIGDWISNPFVLPTNQDPLSGQIQDANNQIDLDEWWRILADPFLDISQQHPEISKEGSRAMSKHELDGITVHPVSPRFSANGHRQVGNKDTMDRHPCAPGLSPPIAQTPLRANTAARFLPIQPSRFPRTERRFLITYAIKLIL